MSISLMPGKLYEAIKQEDVWFWGNQSLEDAEFLWLLELQETKEKIPFMFISQKNCVDYNGEVVYTFLIKQSVVEFRAYGGEDRIEFLSNFKEIL